MKHNHERHPRLKHVPHPDEHKNDDGSPNLAAVEAGLPAIVSAIKSGNPQLVDFSMTDPGPNGEYYVIFHMRAK